MLVFSLVIALCAFKADGVVQNTTCPLIAPREIDLKNLDGRWYITSIASNIDVQGDCATVTFSHKSDNSTDISISWVQNRTASFYNGSVALSFDPKSNSTEGDMLVITFTDKKLESYYFVTLDYEHYAVVLACTNNDDGMSSTYELWELSRTPHVKPKHVSKIYNALSSYNLQNTTLITFNNTDESCEVSSAGGLAASSLVLTSAAALALFRRLY